MKYLLTKKNKIKEDVTGYRWCPDECNNACSASCTAECKGGCFGFCHSLIW